MEDSPTPVTVLHGGPGGHELLSFDVTGNSFILCKFFLVHARNFIITANEELVAVYGTRVVNPSPWGEKRYVIGIYLHHL